MQLQLLLQRNKKVKGRYHKQIDLLLNHMREERFNNRYHLNEEKKHYDALDDPYTSYYFSNSSVKDHLKKYKRALKKEQFNETEKNVISQKLRARIKQKFTDYICPKTSVYEQGMSSMEIETLTKKSSANLFKRRTRNSLSNNCTQDDILHKTLSKPKRFPKIKLEFNPIDSSKEIVASPKLNQQDTPVEKQSDKKTRTAINDSTAKANRLAEELHQKKHQKWIKFLEEKKQNITKMKEEANSCLESSETKMI